MIKKFNFYQIRAIKIPERGKRYHENDREMMEFIRQNRLSGGSHHGSAI